MTNATTPPDQATAVVTAGVVETLAQNDSVGQGVRGSQIGVRAHLRVSVHVAHIDHVMGEKVYPNAEPRERGIVKWTIIDLFTWVKGVGCHRCVRH